MLGLTQDVEKQDNVLFMMVRLWISAFQNLLGILLRITHRDKLSFALAQMTREVSSTVRVCHIVMYRLHNVVP